jgi:hypothetical protein
MTTQNIHHGHETEEHWTLKAETLRMLKGLGFAFVLCEKGNSDLVASRTSINEITAVEIERSVRNLLRNIRRNFASGCKNILIVSPNFKVTGEIARKLDRELPSDLRERVGILTASALRIITPPQT